jgi:hypothetical protein
VDPLARQFFGDPQHVVLCTRELHEQLGQIM